MAKTKFENESLYRIISLLKKEGKNNSQQKYDMCISRGRYFISEKMNDKKLKDYSDFLNYIKPKPRRKKILEKLYNSTDKNFSQNEFAKKMNSRFGFRHEFCQLEKVGLIKKGELKERSLQISFTEKGKTFTDKYFSSENV